MSSGTVRLGFQSECDQNASGTVRYHHGVDEVQICTDSGWIAVASSPAGNEVDIVPTSCESIFAQNPGLPDGGYYIKTPTGVEEHFCTRVDFVPPEPAPLPNIVLPNITGCTIPIAENYNRYATIANNSACVGAPAFPCCKYLCIC